MFGSLTRTLSLGFLILFYTPFTVHAALENSTIDDQDFSQIDYQPPSFWSHDPLIGYEQLFYDGSRSYTYTPKANATFVFTGSGIYLQGSDAPGQALRRVFLDGVDQGQYDAYAPVLSQCAVYWGKGDLEYATHTVIVAHNDTPSKILALDAFIVEFDPTQTPLPYSTTTTTLTSTPPTTASTSSSTNWDSLSKHRSYSNVIIGIVVPILLLLLFCIVGLCVYRNRRSRTRQRKRDSFREKLFRSRTPVSVSSRPISFRTVNSMASTHYETADEHVVESTQNNMQNLPDIREPSPLPHGLAIPPTLAPSADTTAGHTTPESNAATPASYQNDPITPTVPTFIPPPEWRTTLSSPVPVSPVSAGNPSAELRTSIRQSSIAAPPSAWVNPSERPHHIANRPSTVFSETDSNNSTQQPTFPRALPPRSPQRPPSVLRRFSAALTSPFTRVPSRADTPVSSHMNNMELGTPGPHNPDNGGPGYFRGMNHFNLGIPLDYRPVASQSPTEVAFPRPPRASEQPVDREGGTSSGDPTSPSTRVPSRAGLDDMALLGYTQARTKVTRVSDDTIEDDEKPEKILENFDGSTMRESILGHERDENWSVGHATVASQADSTRSPTIDRTGQVTPPPYTVLIPPDMKRPMPTE